MPRKRTVKFTPSKRGRVLALRDEKYIYQDIAQKVGDCTASAAWKMVQRELKHHTRHSLPRSGRPPAINDQTQHRIIKALHGKRFMPCSDIANMFKSVTESQVRKTAHAAGYYRRIARHKPFLSHQTVVKRLRWARENDGRDWNGGICWTDETSIERGERPSHARVTRLPGEEYLPENISPTFQSGHDSLMAWACITHN